jgi:uncharacterized protein (TIGR03435 family)
MGRNRFKRRIELKGIGLGVMILACRATFSQPLGQPSAARPAFAAASIKPDDRPDSAGLLRPTPGALTAGNMAVSSYIKWAWNLRGDYQLSVPASLQAYAGARYAIVARADDAAAIDQLRLMLQTLLMERFHLVVHSETRNIPVFALVVANGGPKQLQHPEADNVPHMDLDSGSADGGQRWRFHNEPVSALIGIMSNGLSRPIVDMTGIQGSFDFTFVLPVWNRAEGPLGDHVVSDVFPEVQRQLGLRVQAQTGPIEVLVVDRLDKTPSEN